MSSSELETAPRKLTPTRMILVLLPLVLFVILAGVFFKQLTSGKNANTLPSVLIGKPAPTTKLPPLEGLKLDQAAVPGIDTDKFIGRITVLNVFASWCLPCRAEHPLLMELSRDKRFAIVGLNYKELKPRDGLGFLTKLGNPYSEVGVDPKGRSTIDWGVYGIPESFIVDRSGTIVYKQVGPLNGSSFRVFKQEIEKALAG